MTKPPPLRLFDQQRAENAIREFLIAIGEDITDDQIRDTPQRVTAMYCQELLEGHFVDTKLKVFPTHDVGNSFVVMTNLQVNSMCCHHLMPITGVAHVGVYFTEERNKTNLPGISKYQRIVSKYARRLQLQERMTHQIAQEILEQLHPDWVMVYVKAQHHCMIHRGVESPNSQTTTTSVLSTDGFPLDRLRSLKQDFMQEIQIAR